MSITRTTKAERDIAKKNRRKIRKKTDDRERDGDSALHISGYLSTAGGTEMEATESPMYIRACQVDSFFFFFFCFLFQPPCAFFFLLLSFRFNLNLQSLMLGRCLEI